VLLSGRNFLYALPYRDGRHFAIVKVFMVATNYFLTSNAFSAVQCRMCTVTVSEAKSPS